MVTKVSLVERKKMQWAKEKEELSRLCGNWSPFRTPDSGKSSIRICQTSTSKQLDESSRALKHYNSTNSLVSLPCNCSVAFTNEHRGSDSRIVCLRDKLDNNHIIRRRSPSLPPIYSKDPQFFIQEQNELGVEGSRYPVLAHRCQPRSIVRHANEDNSRRHQEEREGETSGYASDSVDPQPSTPCRNRADVQQIWKNPYNSSFTEESSITPSRRFSTVKTGEFIRPRWGSVWGQDASKGDLTAPSWLERGLSRLDHSNQALVINHESASSPDGSTAGSMGSDSNKTFLRGQNVPVNPEELHERESRRQKALDLQNAIKQQLEEKENQKKKERERKMKEERDEEERIQRERDKDRRRFEEEQQKQREKEEAKEKKAQAMREMLEEAERKAKAEKKQRRQKLNEEVVSPEKPIKPASSTSSSSNETPPKTSEVEIPHVEEIQQPASASRSEISETESCKDDNVNGNSIKVPVSKDVTIVLSGRLEDPELLTKSNLQMVNLVMSTSPTEAMENAPKINSFIAGLINSPIVANFSTSRETFTSPKYSAENRLLTPRKYRSSVGCDFATQTDSDELVKNLSDNVQGLYLEDSNTKEQKDAANSGRKEADKFTDNTPTEDSSSKPSPPYRAKKTIRKGIESRPRWNANRPGTRYRTQSEKDPHYKGRTRLKARHIETSDEGSRSPSPERRRFGHFNSSLKSLKSSKRKTFNTNNYDTDLAMEKLNFLVPYRTVMDGQLRIENAETRLDENASDSNREIWCVEEIIPGFSNSRNDFPKIQTDWDLPVPLDRSIKFQ